MCLRRTALETLLTFWPPGPLERANSISTSLSLISTSMSSMSGTTSTAANEVWRRPLLSKGDMRTSRCTPISLFR